MKPVPKAQNCLTGGFQRLVDSPVVKLSVVPNASFILANRLVPGNAANSRFVVRVEPTSVLAIQLLRNRLQVIWIHTVAVVALMVNNQTIRRWAVR